MDSYLGEIIFFAGNYVPEGYVACGGQLLPVSGNEALFSLLGTTYGGNGNTDFGVPDLRARLSVGFGAGPGLPHTYIMGQKYGTYLLSLTTANVPAHTHQLMADSSGKVGVADPIGAYLTAPVETGTGTSSCYVPSTTTGLVAMASDTVGLGGGANSPQPVDLRMPTLTLTPIMCTVGTFPMRP